MTGDGLNGNNKAFAFSMASGASESLAYRKTLEDIV
jgi:hypothetical protein